MRTSRRRIGKGTHILTQTRAHAYAYREESIHFPTYILRARAHTLTRGEGNRVERSVQEQAFTHYREQGKRVKAARDRLPRGPAGGDLLVRCVPTRAHTATPLD
jgi:hypothetical protein